MVLCLVCLSWKISAIKDRFSVQSCGIVVTIVLVILGVLCSITNLLWYFIDWIRVLAGDFKDGNGVPLKDW